MIREKLLALLLSLLLVFSLFAGCANNKGETTPSGETNSNETEASTETTAGIDTTTDGTPASSAPDNNTSQATSQSLLPEAPATVTFIDSVGREVEVPANISRISPSGSLAQMFLIAIAPDLIITTSSEYSAEEIAFLPQNISGLPVVGQFYGTDDLNIESIAAIGPEIVIDVGEPKKTIVEDMDSITTNLAIPSVHITATLNSAPEAFRQLGKLLGREEKGEQLAAFCEMALSQTLDIMTKVGDNKKSMLYCLGDAGLNVLAATSIHAEVIDLLTNNLAVVNEPSSRGMGNETDHEQLLMWDPEIILFAPNSVYDIAVTDSTWQQMQAVASGKYYEVPYGPYNWMGSPPAINRYLGMLWLTKLLYPQYAQYDLYEMVTEYYNLFYGHTLTQAEYDALMKNSLTPAVD